MFINPIKECKNVGISAKFGMHNWAIHCVKVAIMYRIHIKKCINTSTLTN